MKFMDKDLASIQESRILMEQAKRAMGRLASFPQNKLDEILEAIYKSVEIHFKELANISVQETGYGCIEDEYKHMEQLLQALQAELKNMKCIGVLAEDKVKRTKDIGVPLGIVTVLCPAVSPAVTAITSAFLCIKSGNAAVFIPDPRAVNTIKKVISILTEAAYGLGFPKGALQCMETIATAGIKAAIENESVSVILNIGVQTLLETCLTAKKPLLYGSTGPSPVFIERTAKVKQAIKDIIASRSFNNGMMSGAEQYVIVDSLIANEVKQEMLANGAYFMEKAQEKALLTFLVPKGNKMDLEYIGKSATWLANKAGFQVPVTTKVLVSENTYIADRNPYAKEFRCPLLVYYIEQDWIQACEKCMNLLVEESKGHSLVIHSEDEEVITQFALKKTVARMLVNTPAVQGVMGLTTGLFPTMAFGGQTIGIGSVAENISPMNLIYIRKVGYGIRTVEEQTIQELIKRVMKQLNQK
jgi:NAD-dependent aldehyde dehydrogenases